MPINSFLRAVVLGATVCLFAGCSSAGTLTPGGRQVPNAAGSAAVAGSYPRKYRRPTSLRAAGPAGALQSVRANLC